MVATFGVEIPLFEILLVLSVFMTAGLIFILLELRKISQYLAVERSDLQRFEQDIGVLEQEENRLADEENIIQRKKTYQ